MRRAKEKNGIKAERAKPPILIRAIDAFTEDEGKKKMKESEWSTNPATLTIWRVSGLEYYGGKLNARFEVCVCCSVWPYQRKDRFWLE